MPSLPPSTRITAAESRDKEIRLPKDDGRYRAYPSDLKPGAVIDYGGVAHEPGSAAAKHMTYMRCPLRGIDSLDVVRAYPLPDFAAGDTSHPAAQVQRFYPVCDWQKGRAAFPAPTHLLEPEVPWENILAYVEVCRSYRAPQ